MDSQNRAISYIDGFNLYFGLKSRQWQKYYWLNPVALSTALLKPDQHLQHCHYFTARVPGNSNRSAKKQNNWLDALATLEDITIHYGHYQKSKSPHKCGQCGHESVRHEEKMTDVNIASQLLVDAYEDRFDTALVISGDGDLFTPVRLVAENFGNKRVIVVFPPERFSAKLRQAATADYFVGKDKLRRNLLPEVVTAANGYKIQCPADWR